MTPREYLDVARERWRLVVAGLLLGLLIAGALTYLMPRQYAAAATVIVATQPTPDVVGTSDDEEISSQRISTYAELLSSRRLAADVVNELGLPTTPDELARRITVITTPDSVLLTATVTDGSPDQAVRIVNAVAAQFIANVAEIEQPADPARPPQIAAKVFEAASPPADQVAPRPVLYIACGVLIGLILGLAAAVLRNAVDARIKKRRQLEDVLGVPVLGTIVRDPKIAKSPLVIYGAPHTPLAEAFRQLRTNVQFVDIDREHKVIVVTSATYGEGRSTTVCNLGLVLAEAGISVLVVDADLRRPSIAQLLSIDGTIGLTDVLINRVRLERALQPIAPALDVLPSGLLPPNPSELLGSNRMVDLIRKLRGSYDVVLIDTSPLLPVTDAAVLAPRADGVLLVVRHGRTVVQDVQAAKDALQAVSGRILGSILTMAPRAARRKQRGRPYRAPVRAAGPPSRSTTARRRPLIGWSRPAEAAVDGDPRPPTEGVQPDETADATGQALDRGGSASGR